MNHFTNIATECKRVQAEVHKNGSQRGQHVWPGQQVIVEACSARFGSRVEHEPQLILRGIHHRDVPFLGGLDDGFDITEFRA